MIVPSADYSMPARQAIATPQAQGVSADYYGAGLAQGIGAAGQQVGSEMSRAKREGDQLRVRSEYAKYELELGALRNEIEIALEQGSPEQVQKDLEGKYKARQQALSEKYRAGLANSEQTEMWDVLEIGSRTRTEKEHTDFTLRATGKIKERTIRHELQAGTELLASAKDDTDRYAGKMRILSAVSTKYPGLKPEEIVDTPEYRQAVSVSTSAGIERILDDQPESARSLLERYNGDLLTKERGFLDGKIAEAQKKVNVAAMTDEVVRASTVFADGTDTPVVDSSLLAENLAKIPDREMVKDVATAANQQAAIRNEGARQKQTDAFNRARQAVLEGQEPSQNDLLTMGYEFRGNILVLQNQEASRAAGLEPKASPAAEAAYLDALRSAMEKTGRTAKDIYTNSPDLLPDAVRTLPLSQTMLKTLEELDTKAGMIKAAEGYLDDIMGGSTARGRPRQAQEFLEKHGAGFYAYLRDRLPDNASPDAIRTAVAAMVSSDGLRESVAGDRAYYDTAEHFQVIDDETISALRGRESLSSYVQDFKNDPRIDKRIRDEYVKRGLDPSKELLSGYVRYFVLGAPVPGFSGEDKARRQWKALAEGVELRRQKGQGLVDADIFAGLSGLGVEEVPEEDAGVGAASGWGGFYRFMTR